MTRISISLAWLVLLPVTVSGFVVTGPGRRLDPFVLFAESGSGDFEKSYGSEASAPIRDMIDSESAMAEFFRSNEEWSRLFRSMAHHEDVPAMDFLKDVDDSMMSMEDGGPWRALKGMPEGDDKLSVVANFLDSMQQALIDIPVNEAVNEDENDLHFLEEGRRMLCVSRFHVLQDIRGGSVEHRDELFATVWSELNHLRSADEPNTGSLILLPDYDMSDLRRFMDMNLHRPLEWLGIDSALLEVACLERGSPAIRVLHKLSDMPNEPWNEDEDEEEETSTE
eukprot:CAMPEP_0198282764 /NCGR_PEP_ID=MMETSP1449-20131203/2527_1 /TAXON_ID=420275 /ORGANISM="Attheya septentrionalis, Strain CCMP2084" /LENGTH=280 /DNA_ID=CAMNT_0043979155 /DNA_START=97 /DNA_END=939 /DNA_ORIENTATION=+